MSDRFFCREGGALVPGYAWLPDLDADHAWGARGPTPGCNQVRCAGCQEMVASWPDLKVASGAPLAAEMLHRDGPAAGLASGGLVDMPDARLYACACTVTSTFGHRILAPEGGPDRGQAPLPWRCDGHPRLALPATVDGEHLSLDDLEATVAAALAGQLPAATPWPADQAKGMPAAWVARLYVILGPGPPREAIGRAAAAACKHADARTRGAALDFYLTHPIAPGAERVSGLVRDTPEAFGGIPIPWFPSVDLSDLTWRVLEQRLFVAGADGGAADATALDLARASALQSATGRDLALMRIAHWDRAWFHAHLPDVCRANPALLPSAVCVLEASEADDAIAALVSVRDSGAVDPAVLQDAVRGGLYGPNREAILSAVFGP